MVRVWKTKSQIWPTNGFLKAKSSSFHFHKNDVTWPLSAKGLFDPLGHLTEHWQENWPCYCWDLGERFVSINRLFPKMDESSTTCDKIVSAWFGVTDGLRTDNGPNLVLGDRELPWGLGAMHHYTLHGVLPMYTYRKTYHSTTGVIPAALMFFLQL